jgi:hypothetical protein
MLVSIHLSRSPSAALSPVAVRPVVIVDNLDAAPETGCIEAQCLSEILSSAVSLSLSVS